MSKKIVAALLFFIFSLPLVACNLVETAARRPSQNPSSVALDIVEMPRILQKGETGTFTVKTDIGNTCLGGVGYRDESGKWTTVTWPESEADETGLCKWTWTVPLQSAVGNAEFRVAARRRGDLRTLVPRTFCIQVCP